MPLLFRESLDRLHVTSDALEAWCHKWKVVELAFFGSVLREDFRPDSDVDVMVRFAENAQWGLFEFSAMADELEIIFDRRVDLLTRNSIERSRNYIRRKDILGTAQVVYAA